MSKYDMSTQYNTQQKPYDEMRKSTISIVERVNIREKVSPFIKNITVPDLACGGGFYSRAFLRWGAKKVVGVDVSRAMLEEARGFGTGSSSGEIEFLEADASKLVTYPE